MKAVIMAAGQSTRTYPLTQTRPKALLTIANKTILEHQLDSLPPEVESVVLVVAYRADQTKQRFGDRYGQLRLQYVEQTEQRGTGHALLQCAYIVDQPFMAMNGDDLFVRADLANIARVSHGALVKSVEDPRLYGIYELDAAQKVSRIVEKPTEVTSNLANVGVYKFTTEIFDILERVPESERGEIELTSGIQGLIDRGEFDLVKAHGHWLAVGYAWDLLYANDHMLKHHLETDIQGDIDPAAHITGNVRIGKGTRVRPGSVIEGPCVIGANCDIGPNCWIRPGTSIGHGCRVGQGSELKNTILMDGSKIPHLSYVGDSVIGADVNFGCGTVTANLRHDGANVKVRVKGALVDTGRRKLGAIVGDGVHTGIHTSIYPGRQLWPQTSTRPGAVVDRDVMPDESATE